MTLESTKKVRIEAMLDALQEGVHETDKLLKAADEAENRITNKRGSKSEYRFTVYAKDIPVIRFLRHSTFEEEAMGIDFWIEIDKFEKELPVQIKSSNTGVKNFRSSKHYQKLEKRIIVLNTGPRISKKRFKTNFHHEIQRIKKLLLDRSA